ncbi:antirestriction protein ArdA [Dyadobacter subterraneus]|uniref:Antirestriction protein ArdA n=1 Tax=Dyadobacter subterraneus TaxID=2773304 RepID=A0ABR9WMU3_9BACT|nr:antirestriction protein ArdA [Dyadobacter subterraneus]MBE9465484.1 antirestriction protein ArdA [Dyadobacter subterraneus]
MKNLRNIPKIYVGTYWMYNSGSLFGKWFVLSDYADAEELYKDCYEYHRNEFLPELMFQDWECIPGFLISKCSLHEDTFRYFETVSEMDDQRAEAFELYCSNIISWPANGNDLDETLEGFNEAYQGYYGGAMKDPKTEFAYQYIEDIGLLERVPQMLERYFDYEAFGRDMFLGDYSEYDGHIFLDM